MRSLILLYVLTTAICAEPISSTTTTVVPSTSPSPSPSPSSPEVDPATATTAASATPEDSAKSKRTIGQMLGYGYNAFGNRLVAGDFSEQRAFYTPTQPQQYHTVRYYPNKASEHQGGHRQQETVRYYQPPQQSSGASAASAAPGSFGVAGVNPSAHYINTPSNTHQDTHDVTSQALLYSKPYLHQQTSNQIYSHAPGNVAALFSGSANAAALLGGGQHLGGQHLGGHPFLAHGSPLLFQHPSNAHAIGGLNGLLQHSHPFVGPQVIPVIILRVPEASHNHGPTVAYLQQTPFAAQQQQQHQHPLAGLNLQSLLLQYLQNQQAPAYHTAAPQQALYQESPVTKTVYIQPSMPPAAPSLVSVGPAAPSKAAYASFSNKKPLVPTAAPQKPRKTSVSIEQAQNIDNTYTQYKYNQYKEKA